MSSKRLIKQLIYGSGYLAVIFLILYGVYFIWFKSPASCFDNRRNQGEIGVDCGGPCQSCEIKALSPLAANWVKYFPVEEKTVITAEIKNPNSDYGAANFSYIFDISGKNGEKIKSLAVNSFIYNSEIKYLMELAEISSKEIGSVRISLANAEWKPAAEFPRPKVQTREIGAKIRPIDKRVEVSGVLINENTYSLSKIKIISFLAASNNVLISASKTEMENLEAFGERPFTIVFPKGFSLVSPDSSASSPSFLDFTSADPTKTKIYVEAIR